jgi:hypothetical protein
VSGWHIKHSGADNCLVLRDKDIVIGSARRDHGSKTWRVEILWSGPGGDYKFEGNSLTECRAYVAGVEAAQQRLLPGHRLVDDTLTREQDGILARCTCGWSSGGHFSSMAASAAFREHQEAVL